LETLIIYASKYGCTEDCAVYLKNKLTNGATLVDVNKMDKRFDISGYGKIIIGGSVYIGKVAKKLRAFCVDNLNGLNDKEVGIFLCCALGEQADEVLANNFPPELIKNARSVKIFGSEARLEKMGLIDRTLIKAVTKGDFSKFVISHEQMDEFIKEMDREEVYIID